MVDSGPGMSIGEITVITDCCSSVDMLFESMLAKSNVSGGGAHNALNNVGGASRSGTRYIYV